MTYVTNTCLQVISEEYLFAVDKFYTSPLNCKLMEDAKSAEQRQKCEDRLAEVLHAHNIVEGLGMPVGQLLDQAGRAAESDS